MREGRKRRRMGVTTTVLLEKLQCFQNRALVLEKEGYYDLAAELRSRADELLTLLAEQQRREQEASDKGVA